MKFPDDTPVTPAKKTELRERLLRLGVVLGNIDEQAVKGTGPGGQKVNKTQSGVLLRYKLGDELLVIKWTRERHHALNRFLALRELCDEVEVRVSPATSARLADIERARKQKDRTRRRQLARSEPADSAPGRAFGAAVGPGEPARSKPAAPGRAVGEATRAAVGEAVDAATDAAVGAKADPGSR